MVFTRSEMQIQKVLQQRKRSQVGNAHRKRAEATQMLSGKRNFRNNAIKMATQSFPATVPLTRRPVATIHRQDTTAKVPELGG